MVFWLLRTKRSQLRFKKLSWHDGLTGIFNRQHFMNEAARILRLLEKRAGHACLVFIDLDHFKQINDTHGHAMGDLVLKHAVAICGQQLRPGDVFGRLGGEEFGMLLGGCPKERGMLIADRIRMAIEASPVTEEGCVVSFSTSAGLAATATMRLRLATAVPGSGHGPLRGKACRTQPRDGGYARQPCRILGDQRSNEAET